MYKKSISKFNSAFALEYVVLLMAFVIAVTAIVLTYANVSVSATKSYQNYVIQKRFLDDIAYSFIKDGVVFDIDNDFSVTFEQTENVLVAKKDENVLLTVEVIEENGERKPIKYVYGE